MSPRAAKVWISPAAGNGLPAICFSNLSAARRQKSCVKHLPRELAPAHDRTGPLTPLYLVPLGQQQIATIPDRDLRRFGKTLQ
jgi:hypothetical protein